MHREHAGLHLRIRRLHRRRYAGEKVHVNRTYWISAAVVAAAALAWSLVIRPPEDDLSPGSSSPALGTDFQAEPEPGPAREPQREAPQPAEPAAPSEPAAPAEPAAAAPQAPEQAPAAPEEHTHLTAPERTGPVDELRALYENEPRNSAAPDTESKIAEVFRNPELPGGLVKSVLCRTTVCKVETRWNPERGIAFMGGFMRLVVEQDGQPPAFEHNLAIQPGESEADGSQKIDVYLKRAAPQ